MLVVDDHNLLRVLAGQFEDDDANALEAGEVFTTGSWYWRLARAVRDPASSGQLTRAFAALGDQSQASVRAALADLPAQVGLYGARELVPVMTSLRTPRRVNLLTGEAVATALLLDATIVVATRSDLMAESCQALDIPMRFTAT